MENPTETKPATEPALSPVNHVPPESQTVTLNRFQIVSLCATGLLISFFLPWLHVLFGKVSGLDFAKQGGQATLLYALPVFCVVTIIAGLAKQKLKIIGQLTGIIPFLILAYGLNRVGSNLFEAIEYGGYLSLLLGFIIALVSLRLK